MMNWQPIETEELETLLKSVESKGMPGLFSSASSKAQKSVLPFYDGYVLYDLKNYSTLPVFAMQYLGNGKDFNYLDGSPDPVYMVNENTPALVLSEENIFDYVRFFFTYVSTLDEETEMIQDPENSPYFPYLSENQKQVISNEKAASNVQFNDQTQLYSIQTPLYYEGSLVKALIEIDQMGHVKVKNYKMLFGMEGETQNAAL